MDHIKQEPEDYDDSQAEFNVSTLCRIDIKEESSHSVSQVGFPHVCGHHKLQNS